MIKQIIQIILEKVFGKGIEGVGKEAATLYNQIAGAKKWKKAFASVAEFSEHISKEACIEISRHYAMLRFYYETFEAKNITFPREDFIIALAMEFNDYNININTTDIIALADAYIDSWKKEVIKISNLKETCFINSCEEINRNDILEVISDKEKLIRAFFKGYEDKDGTNIIRIYYPAPGETWIEWKEKYSIEIKANLNKGMPLGFCRVGYDYSLIQGDKNDRLIVAYLSEKKDREILRVNKWDCQDDTRIVWAY
jgi:hypothetical protein